MEKHKVIKEVKEIGEIDNLLERINILLTQHNKELSSAEVVFLSNKIDELVLREMKTKKEAFA